MLRLPHTGSLSRDGQGRGGLDLKLSMPASDKLRIMLDHAQILGVEDVSAALIFVNRHILAVWSLPQRNISSGTDACRHPGLHLFHQEIAQQAPPE